MQYRPYLDGLRALAVLSVVAFHGFPSVLTGGFVGVDVFFVLSGFLITYIVAAEIRNDAFAFTTFYARRIRRLLPAALVVYVTTFVVAVFVLEPQQLKEFGRSLRATVLFVSNYFFASRTGYFDAPAHEQPLLHTWSLAIEEQFYIIWPPLLMLTLRRLNGIWRMAILLSALILSLGYADVMARIAQSTTFFSFPARGWELLLGAALALTIDRTAFRPAIAEALAAAGLLGIGLSCVYINDTTIYPGLSALPACAGTCLVIMSSFRQETLASKLLSLPAIVFVGLTSYSLYLWHWPLLTLGRIYMDRPIRALETATLIALAFLLSAVTWRYVEQPFRSGNSTLFLPPRATLAAGIGFTAAMLALGLAASRNEAWLWGLDAVATTTYQQQYSHNPFLPRCDGNGKVFADDEFCNLGVAKPAKASFDFAIFGDSNASHWAPAYAVLAKEQGLSGRQVTQSICAPLIGVNIHVTEERKNQCRLYQRQIMRFVEANPGLKLAILSANWITYQGQLGQNELVRLVPAPVADAAEPARRTTLEDHLLATIRYLRNRGIKVQLIGQIPYQRIDRYCLLNSLRAGDDAGQCGIAADAGRQPIASSNDLFRRIAAQIDGVTATIPADFMCDEARCPLWRDGTMLYRDFGHLSAAGAIRLASEIRLPP